jgi:hypothetical protein
MEARFDLLPEDLTAFARYRAKHPDKSFTAQMRSSLLALMIVAHFGVVPTVLMYALPERDTWLLGGMIVLAQIACWVVAYVVVLGGRLRPRAQLKKGHDKDIRLAIGPDWFSYANRFAETAQRWVNIDKIAVTNDHTFFFTTATGAYLLPRHAFADNDEYFEFAEEARRYHNAAKAFKDNPYEDVT